MEAPIAQATGHNNNIVAVYSDHVELRSGWQGQNVEKLEVREVSEVSIRGLVNCTLSITSNKGQVHQLARMALPDARGVKAAIERQKQKAGSYE